MTLSIYSRAAIEKLNAEGRFPENTAVITFYAPAIKRIDKAVYHKVFDAPERLKQLREVEPCRTTF